MANSIYHLVLATTFRPQAESQPYLPTDFTADGFIHCTGSLELMLSVANRFYQQVEGEIWILVIDPDRVTAEIKREAPAHPDGTPPPPGASPSSRTSTAPSTEMPSPISGSLPAPPTGRSSLFEASRPKTQRQFSRILSLLIITVEAIMVSEFTAVFEQDGDWWVAFVEELPGANTQGATLEEARENLKEAVTLIIEANRELAEQEIAGRSVIRESLAVSV